MLSETSSSMTVFPFSNLYYILNVGCLSSDSSETNKRCLQSRTPFYCKILAPLFFLCFLLHLFFKPWLCCVSELDSDIALSSNLCGVRIYHRCTMSSKWGPFEMSTCSAHHLHHPNYSTCQPPPLQLIPLNPSIPLTTPTPSTRFTSRLHPTPSPTRCSTRPPRQQTAHSPFGQARVQNVQLPLRLTVRVCTSLQF